LKRVFDLLFSVAAIITTSPLLLVLSLQSMRKIGSPILFWQTRPGLRGSPFRIVKFRTMVEIQDEAGTQSSDSERMTDFGNFLRSTSLDELPELWNVIKGDMSLVGPRPLLMEYLELYSPEQNRRHEVRPGITGWAQVKGRNNLSWEEKFALDVWYVDNRSMFLDFKILLLTIVKVLKREGISQEGEATMERFKGSDS
jgi:lipopolysaccharide/colanic/teichoic acid biosynthesis glycosyltransferase